MGKDNRAWRKLVKKLRRKRIRQKLAMDRDINEKENESKMDSTFLPDKIEFQELQKLKEEEEKLQHELEEQKWIERELQARLEYQMEKAKQDKLAATKADEERKIREEWEQRQKHEKQLKEEKDRIEKELKEKQVIVNLRNDGHKWEIIGIKILQGFRCVPILFGLLFHIGRRIRQISQFFVWKDIETPPLPYVMPEEVENGKEKCLFFDRTGVCLFAEQCSRNHLRPTLSKTILIPNFFSNFSLEQSLLDEYDTDMCLEYEDSDIYKEFLEFYNDVLPEFRKIGKVIQFKVCCNFGMHLRGNVYIQYETIRESVDAYRKFNARFFNGKQLSLQFAKIDSWKAAICGLFLRKRCLKGKACNFLHVFRSPTKEFVNADHDWKDHRINKSSSRVSPKLTEPEMANHEKRSNRVRRSRSRSRSNRRTKERKSHKHRSRSRSRSSRTLKRPSRSRDRGRDRYKSRDEYSQREKKKSKHAPKTEFSIKEKKKSKKSSKTRYSTCDDDSIANSKSSVTTSQPDVENIPSNLDISKDSSTKEKHKKSKKSKKSKKHKKDKKKNRSQPPECAVGIGTAAD